MNPDVRSKRHVFRARMDTDERAAFAAAVRHSDDAVVHTTAEGVIVAWSAGAERMFGYTAAEARGLSIGILYPAGAWTGAHRYAAGFSAESRQFETVLVTQGGRNVAVRATAFQIAGPGGMPRALGTLYRDISAQKKAERRLLYKDAFASLMQTLVHVANEAETPETAVAEGLRLVCRHYGWQLGHAVAFGARAPMLELSHSEEPARFARFVELAKCAVYGIPDGEVVAQVLEKRAPVWLPDLRAAPRAPRTDALLEAGVRAAFAFPVIVDGEVIAVLEFYGDAPRPPEDALVESIGRVSQTFARMIERQRAADEKAHLAAIVEGAADAIVGRSLDGVITSWNPAAERMLGYTALEAIGRPMAMTLPLERRFLVDANNERLRRGEPVATQESPCVRKDGTIVHVSANVSPVRDRHGAVMGAAVVLRDISETVDARRLLVRKVHFNALLQTLTRTANDAGTPAAALNECLRLIAEHGRWDAARLLRLPSAAARTVSALVLDDHADEGTRGADCEGMRWLSGGAEPVIPRLAAGQEPVWLAKPADFAEGPALEAAREHGMRCAFGFPVVSGGNTLAVLEFFSRAERPPDGPLLENIVALAGQLARVVERHQFVIDIAASERRLRAILDSEPACVKLVSAGGSLITMNRAGLDFLEARTPEEIEAGGLLNRIGAEHRQRFLDSIQRTIAGERCNLEFEIVGLRGTRRWVESHTAPFVAEEGGEVAMLSVTRDITDRKRAEERMNHLAHHDALTGLPNRGLLQDRLRVAIAHARRRAEPVGVLIAGIDRFRKVNESFGYEAGDALLRDVAVRIGSTLREVDTLARLGADQFAILIDAPGTCADLDGVAQKVHASLREPFRVAGRDVFVNVSTGIASFPDDGVDAHALLDSAERAMNRVKDEGGAGYRRSDGVAGHDASTYGTEAALHHALARGELEVHYQPRLDLPSERIVGCEALLRWTNPELGSVSPACFIPIAEETGLIVPVGAWVLETACAQAAAWHRAGHRLSVSVNLSPRQFRQADLPAVVAGALQASGLPAEYLELEITESTAMTNPERAAHVLRELHALGVKLSVDDFGTGYSSLSYLREFPLDCLKIDKSFVRDICTSASNEAIVRATIALAHSLQLAVVGEGVEARDQHERLLELGCDQGQGFLYAVPMPPTALQALLESCAAA